MLFTFAKSKQNVEGEWMNSFFCHNKPEASGLLGR